MLKLYTHIFIIFFLFGLSGCCSVCSKHSSPVATTTSLPAVRDDYRYSPDVRELAEEGLVLYKEQKFVSSFNGGHYTDPIPKHGSYEFWSDGKTAKLDRDSNGHHETIFKIEDGQLKYVGSIGSRGQFVDGEKAQ